MVLKSNGYGVRESDVIETCHTSVTLCAVAGPTLYTGKEGSAPSTSYGEGRQGMCARQDIQRVNRGTQVCCSGVTVVLQWCYKSLTMVLPRAPVQWLAHTVDSSPQSL
jgi:hypothetical protein